LGVLIALDVTGWFTISEYRFLALTAVLFVGYSAMVVGQLFSASGERGQAEPKSNSEQPLLTRRVLWILLTIAGVASWYVYETPWVFGNPVLLLLAILVVSFVLAVRIAISYKFAVRPVLMTILIFGIGQFWPMFFAVTLGLWTIGGFAP
jgi:hypothetical protein